jgi:transcription antitermination factor NusG
LLTWKQNPYLYPLSLLDGGNISSAMNLQGSDSVWWLAYTKPRQEKRLADELRQLEIPHYLPVVKKRSLSRGKTRVSQIPQWSSYLFLRVTGEERRRALETNRILTTLGIVEQGQIGSRLWNLADLIEKDAPLTAEARLQAGQAVVVRGGPFEGKEGVVIKRGGKTRLFIFVMEVLGGVSMEIEQHLLEPIL